MCITPQSIKICWITISDDRLRYIESLLNILFKKWWCWICAEPCQMLVWYMLNKLSEDLRSLDRISCLLNKNNSSVEFSPPYLCETNFIESLFVNLLYIKNMLNLWYKAVEQKSYQICIDLKFFFNVQHFIISDSIGFICSTYICWISLDLYVEFMINKW